MPGTHPLVHSAGRQSRSATIQASGEEGKVQTKKWEQHPHTHTHRASHSVQCMLCNTRLTGAGAVNTNFTSITTRTRLYHRQRPSSTRDSATAALVAIATALQSIEACVGAVGGERECLETITSQTLKTRCHEGASAQSTPTPSFALEAHREGFRGLHLAL